jgi:hypothetical protein
MLLAAFLVHSFAALSCEDLPTTVSEVSVCCTEDDSGDCYPETCFDDVPWGDKPSITVLVNVPECSFNSAKFSFHQLTFSAGATPGRVELTLLPTNVRQSLISEVSIRLATASPLQLATLELRAKTGSPIPNFVPGDVRPELRVQNLIGIPVNEAAFVKLVRGSTSALDFTDVSQPSGTWYVADPPFAGQENANIVSDPKRIPITGFASRTRLKLTSQGAVFDVDGEDRDVEVVDYLKQGFEITITENALLEITCDASYPGPVRDRQASTSSQRRCIFLSHAVFWEGRLRCR